MLIIYKLPLGQIQVGPTLLGLQVKQESPYLQVKHSTLHRAHLVTFAS
jgi:hypothetical protein